MKPINFIFLSIFLSPLICLSQTIKHYDEADEVNIGPNGVTVVETKLSPAQVKMRYKLSAGGACKGFSYKIHEFNNKLYCFFSKDISGQLSIIKKDLSEVTSYFRYYKTDRCIVVQLNDKRDSRTLQGYFTETFCTQQ